MKKQQSTCLNTEAEAEATNIYVYGNCSASGEWKYRFTAFMGIQDNIYPDMLARAERATAVVTDAEQIATAGTPEEAERWIQLANDLKHIPISTITTAAATVYRQHQKAMGLVKFSC
jgi:hypothetical protein